MKIGCNQIKSNHHHKNNCKINAKKAKTLLKYKHHLLYDFSLVCNYYTFWKNLILFTSLHIIIRSINFVSSFAFRASSSPVRWSPENQSLLSASSSVKQGIYYQTRQSPIAAFPLLFASSFSSNRVDHYRIRHNRMSTMDGAGDTATSLRFVDIGANLLDKRFTKGSYRGTLRHEPDLECILQRAAEVGMKRIVLTAGTVSESRKAVQTARLWQTKYGSTYNLQFTCTVGVHPTRCQQVFVSNNNESKAEHLLQELLDIASDGMTDGTVVAIGELGLDYDRLQFCPKEIQQKYFIKQLQHLAKPTGLPLFLHNRSVGNDLYNILKDHSDCWTAGGVVHSFDDTIDLAMKFINDFNLYIGLNGCSLRTDENIQTVSQIPLNKILLETDCPYCDIRSTHPGFKYVKTKFDARPEKKFEMGKTVKNRQEPCHIIQVAEIVAHCHNVPLATVSETCYQNSLTLFQWKE